MQPGPASAIRPAKTEDAAAIGAVHVQAWRETYAGLLPADLLAGLDARQRAAMWEAAIPQGGVFVAEDAAGLAGFAAWSPQRSRDLPFAAEVLAVYLLDRARRRGLGRALMGAMAQQIVAAGLAGVSLWVLDGNTP